MLGFTLPGLALSGASAALLQGGFIGTVASFPPMYMQSVLSGMALAGLLVSASSAVSCTLASESEEAAAFNFSAGFVTLVACIGAYFALHRLPFARHYLNAASAKAANGVAGAAAGGSGSDCGLDGATTDASLLPSRAADVSGDGGDVEECTNGSEKDPLLDDGLKRSLLARPRGSTAESIDMRTIMYKVRWHFATVVITFVATLSVFPGVIALIVSASNAARPPLSHPPAGRIFGDCFPPLLFTIFNATDLAGRLAGGAWASKPPKAKTVATLVTARLLIVPLLCVCNVVSGNPDVDRIGDGNGWRLPVIFGSDASCYLLVAMLGFSNGLPASIVMMHVPGELEESEREAGGALMAWGIVVGVAAGSAISLLLSASLSY